MQKEQVKENPYSLKMKRTVVLEIIRLFYIKEANPNLWVRLSLKFPYLQSQFVGYKGH